MNELVLIGVFIGNLTITSYRSVPAQTDNSPFYTSIGERVNNHGIAISQDLLKAGRIHYGDVVYIDGLGYKIVNDTMNIRMKNSVDVWLETKEQESAFQKKWKSGKVKVWKVKRQI